MNKPSRRAVVRTGVWAVPAVTTAAMAPAFAVTSGGPPPVTISPIGTGCKVGGASGPNSTDPKEYNATITFINCTGTAQTVNMVDWEFTTKTKNDTFTPKTVVVPGACSPADNTSTTSCTTDSKGCVNYDQVFTISSDSSSQASATIQYTVSSTGATVYTTVVNFGGFDPCNCKVHPSLADCAPNVHH